MSKKDVGHTYGNWEEWQGKRWTESVRDRESDRKSGKEALEQSMIIISDRISFILFDLINFFLDVLLLWWYSPDIRVAFGWLNWTEIQTTYKFFVSLILFVFAHLFHSLHLPFARSLTDWLSSKANFHLLKRWRDNGYEWHTNECTQIEHIHTKNQINNEKIH